MIYTVDRLEGNLALLESETGAMVSVPLVRLPQPLSEGEKLEEIDWGYRRRPQLRQAAQEENRRRLNRLLERRNTDGRE